MTWKIVSTKIFYKDYKKHKKEKEFIKALEQKLKRLKENPHNIGGYLSGRLHGYKSTRIIRKLRLLFKIVDEENKVFLLGIDHRKFNYTNF